MKYFAVEHEQAGEVNMYLQSIGITAGPHLYTQFAVLFCNTLSNEDFLVLKLKYDVIVPTQARLQIVESIYQINLRLDKSPA